MLPSGAVLRLVARQLLGAANTGDDVFHVADVDGLGSLLAQFVEQLGDAGLYVIYYLVAALLLSKRGAQ